MEISSHGDKHIMEEKDFIISFNKLREWGINKTKKIGFSIPNSKYTDDELNNFFEKNKDKIQYIRAGRSPSCYSFSMKLSYLIYKFFKIQYFFNLFNTYNINKQTKTRQLYSVVITKNINPKHISNFINKHASNDGLIVLMFHSIVEHPKDKWEYSKKRFTILCEEINHMINSNVIKCLKIEDLY